MADWNKARVLALFGEARRLCLFATHVSDTKQQLPVDVMTYVAALARVYDRVVVIVATDEPCYDTAVLLGGFKLSNVSIARVPNMNLDFGAWACLLRHITYDDVHKCMQELALVNDSCIMLTTTAPVPPVSISMYQEQQPTCWGMVKSYEVCEHIQSFYMVFMHRHCIRLLLHFFHDRAHVLCGEPMAKNDIIHMCEVGLSQFMIRNGVRIAGAYDPKFMVTEMKEAAQSIPRTAPHNLSYSYWDVLVKLGCPLLKRNRQLL